MWELLQIVVNDGAKLVGDKGKRKCLQVCHGRHKILMRLIDGKCRVCALHGHSSLSSRGFADFPLVWSVDCGRRP